MTTVKIIAIVLITAGALGLAYGGFTYTRSTQQTQVGPFSMTFKDRRTVAVPIWLGIGAVVMGAGLLLVPPRKG